MQDALFHEDMFPDDVRSVREEVRRFAGNVVSPRAADIGRTAEGTTAFPRDVFDAMARAGLFAIPFEHAVGGRGLEHRSMATTVAVEELAYASNSVAAIFDVHCILAGQALARGSQPVRERFLEPLIRGEIIAAFATSEPAASSDLSPSAVTTMVRPTQRGWTVHGRKRWITNAPVADFVVALCSDGVGLTLLAIDLHQDAVRVGPPDRKLGNRGQLTADVEFDGAFVPDEHVIGPVGGGLRIALQALTYGRIGIGAAGVGMAQRAFDEAVARLKERRAFGRRLAEFQHWQFRMADRATELESARSMYLKAAQRLDHGVVFPEPEAAMAKILGSALAVDLARDAVQVFGGYGFVETLGATGESFPLETLYRDAKIGEIYEGANEIQRWVIARNIFGRELTG